MMWHTASGTPHSIASATPVNGCRSNSPRLLWRVLPPTFSYSSNFPTSARIAPAITVSMSMGSARPINSFMLSAALRAICTTQRLCSMNVVGQFGTSRVNGMRFRSSGVRKLSSRARCQVLVTCSRSSGALIHSISGHNLRTASRIGTPPRNQRYTPSGDAYPSGRKHSIATASVHNHLGHSSQAPSDMFELVGDFLGWGLGRKAHWLADHDRQLSGARDFVPGHLHLVQAIDPHGDNRDVQPRRQHSDAWAERRRLAIRRAHAFWVNQNAIASVHRFTGIGETLAHTRLLRQRKDVEQGNHQIVAGAIRPAHEGIPGLRRPPHLPQHLTPHANRELVPHARRKRDQREANIDVGNVIATDEERPVDTAQVLAANDLGMRHDHGRRPGEQIVDEVANPRGGPALRPSRIAIAALRRLLRPAQQSFEIANRADAGEVRLVEIDLVAVFQRAH